MTAINLPPLCPICGGNTRLRETHRSPRAATLTCFFRCNECGTDYPRSIQAEEAATAGLTALIAPQGDDRDPAL
ncbi:MAG: hypothetical protein KIT48_20510 [Pseudolabrys sp.]|nr:hypothetical protein [Pseudolabrys sp.]